MSAPMKQALERLYRRRRFGIRPGLDVERLLLEELGRPERGYGVIHVAGTNGKGSVCALLDAVLRAAGLRTGLFTSPHLVSFHERIRVGGRMITDAELAQVLDAVERAAASVKRTSGEEATFFECSAAMALEFFRRREVRVAVIETGMGGRLDATNVVTPLLSVICRISVEHTAYLGDTLEDVAHEKCGIIKPGVPVVCGRMEEKATEIVRLEARDKGAPLAAAPENVSVALVSESLAGSRVRVETPLASYGTVHLPLPGRYQLENLATAVTGIERFGERVGIAFPVPAVRQGLAGVSWPGRCQVWGKDPPVILDGAHNPGAAQALAGALARLAGKRPLALVAGMCADKDAAGFFKPFHGLARKVWVVPIQSERNAPAGVLVRAARGAGCDAVAASGVTEALTRAGQWARAEDGVVCVTGSLFLVGEVIEKGGGTGDGSREADRRR